MEKNKHLILLLILIISFSFLVSCSIENSNLTSNQTENTPKVNGCYHDNSIDQNIANYDDQKKTSGDNSISDIEEMRQVILFKSVSAGSYYSIRISGNGYAEFTNFSRTYNITSHKRIKLEHDQLSEIFNVFTDNNFFNMKDEYSLSPIKKNFSGTKYEDIYYWVNYFDGMQKKTVVAHEYAVSKELENIINFVFNKIRNYSVETAVGFSILAFDYQILPFLRQEETIPCFEQNEVDNDVFSIFQDSVLNLGLLIPLTEQDLNAINYAFEAGNTIKFVINDQHYLIILLVP